MSKYCIAGRFLLWWNTFSFTNSVGEDAHSHWLLCSEFRSCPLGEILAHNSLWQSLGLSGRNWLLHSSCQTSSNWPSPDRARPGTTLMHVIRSNHSEVSWQYSFILPFQFQHFWLIVSVISHLMWHLQVFHVPLLWSAPAQLFRQLAWPVWCVH